MGGRDLKLPLLVTRAVGESAVAERSISQSYEMHLRQEPVSCRKGCANCCYHPVMVTVLEGIRIYQGLVLNDQWSSKLRASLTEHATKTMGLSVEVWMLGMIPCPFLSADKHCEIYKQRPFSCQITYSLGSAEDCHPHNLGAGPLPKRNLLDLLSAVDRPLMERLQLQYFRAPLSVALLYAEAICKGKLDITDFRKALWELPSSV